MTRKDYIKIAAVINKITSVRQRNDTANAMASVLQGDNPRFDYDRFIAACAAKPRAYVSSL